jgi:gamma-glutamylcyclotransferase (GGCT)/AIG2-like uncharacterized protein YtfP
MSKLIQAVFVYGTLKQGQCRARHWPVPPISILRAWTRGTLFDRHDYPAMTPGDDRVLGELWSFRPDDMPAVVRVLDEVEGANQPGQPDLYRRVIVQAWSLEDDSSRQAFAFHYAVDPQLDGFTPMTPDPGGWVKWR